MVTVTWTDSTPNVAPYSFIISDTVFASMESYRLSQKVWDDSSKTFIPTFPSVLAMVMETLTAVVAVPALKAFPTPDLVAAQAAVDTAQAALMEVAASVVSIPPTEPVGSPPTV